MGNKNITNTIKSNSGITVTTVDASSMTPSTNSHLQEVESSNGNFRKISCPNILHSPFPNNDAGVTNNETSSTDTKRFRVGNGTCGQKIPPTKGVVEDNISPGNSLNSG